MSQYESSKKSVYKLYESLYETDLVYGKKKDILRSLFIGENWTWRIIKISKNVVIECKNNNFVKPARRFERHHADEFEFSKTASAMLKDEIMSFDEWANYVENHENTYLLTKEEHKNWEKNSKNLVLYDLDLERNLFRNSSRGWKHGKSEKMFLRDLVEKNRL
jgi:hypothetical protein